MVYYLYGHGGHLGTCTVTILAIVRSHAAIVSMFVISFCFLYIPYSPFLVHSLHGISLYSYIARLENLSTIGPEASEEKSFKILNIFPIQLNGPIKCKGKHVVFLSVCHFVLVFFSPFSIAITSFGEERDNLSAFRTFVWFVFV